MRRAYAHEMPVWLVVVEAHSHGAVYSVFLDVLERRLGAWRVLRTAWAVEAASAETVAESLAYYLPYDDGLLVLPFSGPRIEKNLRDAHGSRPAIPRYCPQSVVGQETPE